MEVKWKWTDITFCRQTKTEQNLSNPSPKEEYTHTRFKSFLILIIESETAQILVPGYAERMQVP